MTKKKSKMFPRKPTKKEVKKWTEAYYGGLDINEIPKDIRTYIAILLEV